jgi:hypothetical protein
VYSPHFIFYGIPTSCKSQLHIQYNMVVRGFETIWTFLFASNKSSINQLTSHLMDSQKNEKGFLVKICDFVFFVMNDDAQKKPKSGEVTKKISPSFSG